MHRIASLLSLTLLLAGAGVACAEDEPFGRLSVADVDGLLGQPDVRIFDVNTAEIYAKGHVPSAVWSDLGGVVGKLPADKSLRLVFYCKNGH